MSMIDPDDKELHDKVYIAIAYILARNKEIYF